MRATRVTVGLLLIALVSIPAFAASNRVFVSSTGLDTNPCTIASPCRTFAYGMTVVNPAGEIIALDTAGYGPVTVGQSVTLVAAPGATAFIAVTSGTGITVNAATTDTVNLRGLALSSNGGTYGISVVQAKAVNVEHCVVNGFLAAGIFVSSSGSPLLAAAQVSHSTIRNNSTGILVGYGMAILTSAPSISAVAPPSPTIGVTIRDCEINDNTNNGVWAEDHARVSIVDTMISGNGNGVLASPSQIAVVPVVNLNRAQITENNVGIYCGFNNTQAINAVVVAANSEITHNTTGIQALLDGSVLTRVTGGAGDVMSNTLAYNYTNGAFTGALAAQ